MGWSCEERRPGLPQVHRLPSGYDIHSSPWKITMLLIGKPSISIRAIYTMANC